MEHIFMFYILTVIMFSTPDTNTLFTEFSLVTVYVCIYTTL